MKGKEIKKEKKKERKNEEKEKKTSDYQKEKSGGLNIIPNTTPKK